MRGGRFMRKKLFACVVLGCMLLSMGGCVSSDDAGVLKDIAEESGDILDSFDDIVGKEDFDTISDAVDSILSGEEMPDSVKEDLEGIEKEIDDAFEENKEDLEGIGKWFIDWLFGVETYDSLVNGIN